MDTAASKDTPVLEYARHLLALHMLDSQGKGDSEEAEAVREQMDAPWYAMTPQEQERMGGLSEDLYALSEGGPSSVSMTDKEINAWRIELEKCKELYLRGNIDAWLAFWRKPRPNSSPPPNGIPIAVVHFFQAQCWDKLGDYRTAVEFLKAAEKYDADMTGMVLHALNMAGDYAEATKYANRILTDPKSTPGYVFMAASVLIARANHQTQSQRRGLCGRCIPALAEALRKEKGTPTARRDLPETEEYLVGLLGLCYEIVGKSQAALDIYDAALRDHPKNPDLWLRRGIVFYGKNNLAAFNCLEKAVRFGSKRALPYLLLAQREFYAGRFWDAKRFAQDASERWGTGQLISLAYQIIAMSLSMCNQKIDWVLENFKLAEKFDPNNPAILHNRETAIAKAAKKESGPKWDLQKPDVFDLSSLQTESLGNLIVNKQMKQLSSVSVA